MRFSSKARRITRKTSSWLLASCLSITCVAAAELQERTARAYDRYRQEATQLFLQRVGAGAGNSISRASPAGALREGEVIVEPGQEDGIIDVPGGLVHHWKGRAFIRGVTLAQALSVSYAYNDYHAIYKPVVASELLGRDGNTYRTRLRVRESAGGLSATLDVTARVEYFFPARNSSYSISTSEEIRQVEDAGSRRERYLPAGRDSGYLWRASTLNRFVERDGGIVIEMETLGLSRGFPALLGWVVEPIARRLGRKSVEQSLQEFRTALLARKN